MEPKTLKIVRRFNVAPEVVFDAVSDPDAMRSWWTDETSFDMDLRVGGRWTITRNAGEHTFMMTGEYLEVQKPNRLVYTISMPQFSPTSDVVSLDIVPKGKGCEVTFVQSGEGIAEELRNLPEGTVSGSETGWQQGFDLMELSFRA